MSKRNKALIVVMVGAICLFVGEFLFQYFPTREDPVHRYFSDPEYKQRVDSALQEVYKKKKLEK